MVAAGSGTLNLDANNTASGITALDINGGENTTSTTLPANVTRLGTVNLFGNAAETPNTTPNTQTTAIPSGTNLTLSNLVTLNLQGNSLTVNSLQGYGKVQQNTVITASSLTVGNTSNTIFYGTILSTNAANDVLSLVDNGTATLTLLGANTYSGNTTIGNGTNAGTIAIQADNGTAGGGSGGLGTGPSSAAAGVSNIVLNSSPTSQATLEAIASFTLFANRGIRLNSNGGTIDVVGSATLTYGGAIGGSGGFTKTDGGTLFLNGTTASTYTGATTVSGGMLQIGSQAMAIAANNQLFNSFDLPPPTALTLSSGATLNINPNNGTGNSILDNIGSLSGSGDIVSIGNGTGTYLLSIGLNNTTTSYSGYILQPAASNGAIGLIKTGSGSLTLAPPATENSIIAAGQIINVGSLGAASDAIHGRRHACSRHGQHVGADQRIEQRQLFGDL